MKELNEKLEVLETLSRVYQRLASVSNQCGIDGSTHKVFDNLINLIDTKSKEL
jgi:hypothetical protein